MRLAKDWGKVIVSDPGIVQVFNHIKLSCGRSGLRMLSIKIRNRFKRNYKVGNISKI